MMKSSTQPSAGPAAGPIGPRSAGAACSANLSVGMWQWDVTTGAVWQSPGVVDVLGMEPTRLPAELNGLMDHLHPDDRSPVAARIENAIDRHSSYEATYRVVTPDGRIRWIESRAEAIVDENGRPARYVGSIADVTPRVEKALSLEAREKQLRDLIELLPAAIYTTDAEGRITLYNKAAAELAGNRPELGTDRWCVSWRLYHPDGTPLPHDECPMAVALKEGRFVSDAEAIAERPDGTRIPFIPYPTPFFDESGAVAGAVNMLVDISDRKKHEREVEELNVRLKRAMAETHHRVKNNLQVIAAMIDMLVMKAEGSVKLNEVRSLGAHVRALSIVHELLTRAARKDGDAESVSVLEMLTTLIPLLEQSSGGRIVHADIDDLQLPMRSATALALIVNELVQNGVKYGRRSVNVRLRAAGSYARLEVADDGPGFPDGFDPNDLGTAGLELVQSLASWDLGGSVEYGNGPRTGALVTVEIPLPV